MAVATESPIGPDTWTGSKSPKSFGEVEVAVLQAMETKIPSHDVWSSMAEAYIEIPAVDKGETGTPTTSVDSLPVVEDRGIDALPRHIDLLQLNELNWNQLAGHQEWRTTLHLRNLTWKLCDEGTLQTFLERSGLMESIEKIRVKPGIGQRSGSATLRVKTVEEVGKVAKFFHGRQFPGARSPVAVSFAHSHCRAPDPFKVPQPSFGDPYRVECEHLSDEPLTLPPGL